MWVYDDNYCINIIKDLLIKKITILSLIFFLNIYINTFN